MLLIYIGSSNLTRGLLVSHDDEPNIIIDEPSNVINQLFGKSTTEFIPLNQYVHAIVDSRAVEKNLPVNINATNLFRLLFYKYELNALVKGDCLLYGSLNIKKETDFKNFSIPYDYIIYLTKLQDINYYK